MWVEWKLEKERKRQSAFEKDTKHFQWVCLCSTANEIKPDLAFEHPHILTLCLFPLYYVRMAWSIQKWNVTRSSHSLHLPDISLLVLIMSHRMAINSLSYFDAIYRESFFLFYISNIMSAVWLVSHSPMYNHFYELFMLLFDVIHL